MPTSRTRFVRSVCAASLALASALVLSGCGVLPSFLTPASPAGTSAPADAAAEGADPAAQQQFFDSVMLMLPMVTSVEPSSSWATVEPVEWEAADPSLRETIVGMGLEACARADVAAGVSELQDPAMTWLSARFLCQQHRSAADEFLSNDTKISPTHTMADLFELAVVHDDATAADVLTANTFCIGALALAWDVHAGFTPDATCWLIRVQSVEETGGDAEFISLFRNVDDLEAAAADARFAELAEASGATPNTLSELLDGVE